MGENALGKGSVRHGGWFHSFPFYGAQQTGMENISQGNAEQGIWERNRHRGKDFAIVEFFKEQKQQDLEYLLVSIHLTSARSLKTHEMSKPSPSQKQHDLV